MQTRVGGKASEAAVRLAGQIRLASWLGKHAANKRSRQMAYRLKHRLIEHALIRHPEHFRLVAVQWSSAFGVLLLLGLPTGHNVHCPQEALSGQALVQPHSQVSIPLRGSVTRIMRPREEELDSAA